MKRVQTRYQQHQTYYSYIIKHNKLLCNIAIVINMSLIINWCREAVSGFLKLISFIMKVFVWISKKLHLVAKRFSVRELIWITLQNIISFVYVCNFIWESHVRFKEAVFEIHFLSLWKCSNDWQILKKVHIM